MKTGSLPGSWRAAGSIPKSVNTPMNSRSPDTTANGATPMIPIAVIAMPVRAGSFTGLLEFAQVLSQAMVYPLSAPARRALW